MLDLLYTQTFWMITTGVMVFLNIVMIIFMYLLFKRTHAYMELKSFLTKTPLAIYFQDNRFADLKTITPINGVINDKAYGPFIVSTTYVDKKTKNIIIPFDIDMDGDRTSSIKELVDKFKKISNNEKSMMNFRKLISNEQIKEDKTIKNVTSVINMGVLKSLFYSSAPHNIKSKIEKLVSVKLKNATNIDYKSAAVIFVVIFGSSVLAALVLNNI